MKVLGKFNKKELPEMFQQLGLDSSGVDVKRQNKRELVSCLTDSCLKAKVSSVDILRLELNCKQCLTNIIVVSPGS